MSISTTTAREDYLGTGLLSVYSYNFIIFNEADLLLTVRDTSDVETTLVLNTDYNVSGVNQLSGGNITLTAGALASGYTLTIRRVVALDQETDIRNQGDYFPERVEDTFDRIVMQNQQQQDAIDRSIKASETDPGELTIPNSTERKGGFLSFDVTTGDPIIASGVPNTPVTPYMATVLDDINAAAARATLGFDGVGQVVLTGDIADSAITTNKIADSSVTRAKLASNTLYKIIESVSGTSSITIDKDVVLCNAAGGGFTITLPTITGNAGKILEIKKTDTSFLVANAVTIDGNSADTIDGSATTLLHTQGETVRLLCTSTEWTVLNRRIPSIAQAFSPSGSWVTNTTYQGSLQREGNCLRMWVRVSVIGTPTATTWSLSMPHSLLINSSLIFGNNTTTHLGVGGIFDDSFSRRHTAFPIYETDTTIRAHAAVLIGGTTVAEQIVDEMVPMTWAVTDAMNLDILVPIQGWNG